MIGLLELSTFAIQDWYETEQQELQLTEKLCLGAKEGTDKANFVLLIKCHGMGGTQTWVWSIKVSIIVMTLQTRDYKGWSQWMVGLYQTVCGRNLFCRS